MLDKQQLHLLQKYSKEAHQILKIKSSLPGHEGNAKQVESCRKSIKYNIFNKLIDQPLIGAKEKTLFKLYIRLLKGEGAGNCYEYSLLAKSLLKKESIDCEVLRVTRNSSIDQSHVFLVLNRENGSPNEPSTWNTDTVIYDPFLNKCYMCTELEDNLQLCCYSSITNTVSYTDYDSELDIIDNTIMEEFYSDWKQVIQSLRANEKVPDLIAEKKLARKKVSTI